MNKSLLPRKETKSPNTAKVQLGELMNFIGIISRNMGEGLLIESKVTETAASPKAHPAWVTIHKFWKSWVYSTTSKKLNRLKNILCR